MPEYLAPGVYVEEVSFRPKSIEGVSTSTTAFVGPTRKGPLTGTPEIVTSFGEFERIYGGLANLSFAAGDDAAPNVVNYLAHAVRAFFNNGGSRLFIARTFVPREGNGGAGVAQSVAVVESGGNSARFVAMQAGSGYNGAVTLLEKAAPIAGPALLSAPDGSLLRTLDDDGNPVAQFVKQNGVWRDSNDDALADPAPATELVTLAMEAVDADATALFYENLGFDARHPRFVGAVLNHTPGRLADARQNPYFLQLTGTVSAFALHTGLFGAGGNAVTQRTLALTGGHDGAAQDAAVYADGLARLEDVEDISIVAAPGSTVFASFSAIQDALIAHVEKMKYRIAVLDSQEGLEISQVLQAKGRLDSTRAALYYPWIIVENPAARPGNDLIPKEIAVPPSGFVCGIYARNDAQRGVWKAPANEVVLGALRFEKEVNHAQQELLNPNGVNCLRYFFGRGNRVWGARTTSSDPEWKYVNVRRYFNYLERSIDRSTQWAVFEPNGERLWANIRETVANFLYAEWRSGALLGATPEEAFFVRCDRSTMTQADLDNGRLICEIGVAVLYPAEFVIFRIGQKTADARQ